ncbi:MAG: PIG-L family deacetylase [Phycisphaerales bacterium]|nr:PIG-L family deacetylase [Phycisphaerales bacterium]
MKDTILWTLCLFFSSPMFAERLDTTAIKVLIIIAHPDDETICAGTIYKLTHDYKATIDLVCITNGEAGYKYSTLGNEYYGLELTNSEIGRQYLPTIRKQELLNAGKILSIRNFFFLDQIDDKFSLNPKCALDTAWNIPLIQAQLSNIMNRETYNFVFCLLPTPNTHGQHKAATIMALQAIKNLNNNNKPIILGVDVRNDNDTTNQNFIMLENYPETKLKENVPLFQFDRNQKFGFKDLLDYHIIVNWEIAEHKSQGLLQLDACRGDQETFRYFDINSLSGIEKTKKLFHLLSINHYPLLKY